MKICAQRLQKRPEVKIVLAITMSNGVKLPKTITKRRVILNRKVPSTDEEHVGQSEKLAKIIPNQNSDRPQVNAIALVEMDYLMFHFLRDCKK